VLISDDLPVDESARDELLENFQSTYHGGDGRAVRGDEDEDEALDDDVDEDDEELTPELGLEDEE
jgi:hypothetical protein